MLNVNTNAPKWAKFHAFTLDGVGYYLDSKPFQYGRMIAASHEKAKTQKSGFFDLNQAMKVTDLRKPDPNVQIRKHNHYYKDVRHLDFIDVYRVMALYEVTDPCLQHAGKKILVSGKRGIKDQRKDVQEAIDTLQRWIEMQDENEIKQGT